MENMENLWCELHKEWHKINAFKTDLSLVKNNEFCDFLFTTLTICDTEGAIKLSADGFYVYKVSENINLDQARLMTMHPLNRDLGFNVAIHVVKNKCQWFVCLIQV